MADAFRTLKCTGKINLLNMIFVIIYRRVGRLSIIIGSCL